MTGVTFGQVAGGAARLLHGFRRQPSLRRGVGGALRRYDRVARLLKKIGPVVESLLLVRRCSC